MILVQHSQMIPYITSLTFPKRPFYIFLFFGTCDFGSVDCSPKHAQDRWSICPLNPTCRFLPRQGHKLYIHSCSHCPHHEFLGAPRCVWWTASCPKDCGRRRDLTHHTVILSGENILYRLYRCQIPVLSTNPSRLSTTRLVHCMTVSGTGNQNAFVTPQFGKLHNQTDEVICWSFLLELFDGVISWSLQWLLDIVCWLMLSGIGLAHSAGRAAIVGESVATDCEGGPQLLAAALTHRVHALLQQLCQLSTKPRFFLCLIL